MSYIHHTYIIIHHTYITHTYITHTSYTHHTHHTYIIHTYIIHKYIHHTSFIHHTYITNTHMYACMHAVREMGREDKHRQTETEDTHANVEAFLLLKQHWHIIFLFCEDELCRLAV